MDLVGPLKKAPDGFTHLLVAVDKITKRIEALPVSKIGSEEAIKFIVGSIHRFGVPNSIITDRGTQFIGKMFVDFCGNYGIRIDWASATHPETNGMVERANGMVLWGSSLESSAVSSNLAVDG